MIHWLGLARPTNIRNSIKKLISDRFLNDSDVARVTCKPSVGPDGSPEFGREVTEFWLTERDGHPAVDAGPHI